MDQSDIVPQLLADNQLYLQSLRLQGFPSSHCVAPLQSTATVSHPYIAQHTMPSHGTPGLQDGQLQTPNLMTEGVYASQQGLNPTLQQNTCKPRLEAPLGYTQMLRPVAPPGVTHGLSLNQDHTANLLPEVTFSAQFNRDMSSQTRRAPVLNHRPHYPFHQELNRSALDMPGHSGGSPPVHVFGQHSEESRIQCPSSNVPFRPNLGPHDINFIRRLRKREQNAQNMWKQREHVHGKRNQMSLEDSYDELPPSKQFISEDKMAASMSNLRITGDNKMSTLEKRWKMATKDANRHFAEIESRLSDSESDIESDSECKESGDNVYKRIEVSPELKTALSQKKGPLPDSIIKSMSSNCTQLVLWKPPSAYIDNIISLTKPDDVQQSSSVLPDRTAGMQEEIQSIISPSSTITQLFDSTDDDMDL
ncbi:uncharacterized protein [Asterias amurensis]|uniref:uncharacterized protein isoform X1 n=1 Tax=Asterias amurensis TaxID=7602 RepID=UPI003AB3CF8B